jgi:hypothetical protein
VISGKINPKMDIKSIINDGRYKKQLESLDKEALKLVVDDHIKALEYANIGIRQVEPEKINDIDYLEQVANEMQKLAKMILESRD